MVNYKDVFEGLVAVLNDPTNGIFSGFEFSIRAFYTESNEIEEGTNYFNQRLRVVCSKENSDTEIRDRYILESNDFNSIQDLRNRFYNRATMWLLQFIRNDFKN